MTDQSTNAADFIAQQGNPGNWSLQCDGDMRMMPARDEAEARKLADALFPGRTWTTSTGKLCMILEAN